MSPPKPVLREACLALFRRENGSLYVPAWSRLPWHAEKRQPFPLPVQALSHSGLNPARYVTGLAQAAEKAGASLHARANVTRLERTGNRGKDPSRSLNAAAGAG